MSAPTGADVPTSDHLPADVTTQWWDGPRPDRMREQIPAAESQDAVLKDFVDQFSVAGARVLEVGGSMGPAVVDRLDVRDWVSVDPRAEPSTGARYQVLGASIEEVGLEPGGFDLVFSCNAFEHLNELTRSMVAIRDALAPGGYAFAHYGPIWSGPDGHHLENVSWQGQELIFWRDNPIPHWSHLLLDPDELGAVLAEHFHPDLVARIIHSVHVDDWINRRFFEDYLDAFREAGLTLVSLSGQHVVDYPMCYPEGRYRHPALAQLLRHDPEHALNRRFGPKYQNFRCRDVRVVLRRPNRG